MLRDVSKRRPLASHGAVGGKGVSAEEGFIGGKGKS